MKIQGKIKSDIGFYIGDPVYAFSEENYDDLWGGVGFAYGVHDAGDLKWAVASIGDGDGRYYDNEGREYPVDSGTIALIPVEFVSQSDGGYIFNYPGKAEFLWEDGVFTITLPTGKIIEIKNN